MITEFTTLPLSDDLISKTFDEEYCFVIDYKKSDYKGKQFVTYINNFCTTVDNVSFDVDFDSFDIYDFDTLLHYISAPNCSSVDLFNKLWVNLLCIYKNPKDLKLDKVESFFNDSKTMLDNIVLFLDSFPLYISRLFLKEDVSKYDLIDDENIVPKNIVSLFRSEYLIDYFSESDYKKMCWFKKQFEDNIFHTQFFIYILQNENNIPFNFISQIAAGKISYDDYRRIFNK